MKTIQDVKNEARDLMARYHKGIDNIFEFSDKIVELSAKAHEEATRIEEKSEKKCDCASYLSPASNDGCGCQVDDYNYAIKEMEQKSKQFFEKI